MSERGYTKRDVGALNKSTTKFLSKEMSSADVDIISLGMAAEKISYQATGNLVAVVEVSLNGADYESAGANSSATIVSYSSHIVSSVRVTWVSGSGQLVVAAR